MAEKIPKTIVDQFFNRLGEQVVFWSDGEMELRGRSHERTSYNCGTIVSQYFEGDFLVSVWFDGHVSRSNISQE